MARAEFAAVYVDLDDTVHHQHGRCWQLSIARAEIAALARFEQIFLFVGRLRSVKVARVGQGHVTFDDVWLVAGEQLGPQRRPPRVLAYNCPPRPMKMGTTPPRFP